MQLLRGRTSSVAQLAISPDGRYVAAGLDPCHVWDLHEPKVKPRAVPTGTHGNGGRVVRFLNATQLFVRTALPPGWYRHDLETGVTTDLLRPAALPWDKVCVHPYGELLKVFSQPDERSAAEMVSYRLSGDGVTRLGANALQPPIMELLDFSPAGEHYMAYGAAGGDPARQFHLYGTSTDAVATTFERPPDLVRYGGERCFSPDGRHLFMAVSWRLLRYDCTTGGLPRASLIVRTTEKSWNPPIAAHPDGRRLAVVEDGRAVTFRDADTLEVVKRYDFAMPTVTCVAFTPDGTRCVIGNTKGKVLLFDVD